VKASVLLEQEAVIIEATGIGPNKEELRRKPWKLVSTRSTPEFSPAVLECILFVTPMPPRYAALSLTLLAFAPGSAFARKQETGFLDRAITVSGETYRYQVFVPYNWDKHKKWPVILFLHGAGERGRMGCFKPMWG